MEKGKHKVDTEKRLVILGHETKTMDGSVELTTTFDFSKVDLTRLLYDAATARLIKWRASSGIKKLTTAEALKTLKDQVVDCSKVVERVKHVETPEEKELKELIASAVAKGKSYKEIADSIRQLQAMREEEELEEGESAESEEVA